MWIFTNIIQSIKWSAGLILTLVIDKIRFVIELWNFTWTPFCLLFVGMWICVCARTANFTSILGTKWTNTPQNISNFKGTLLPLSLLSICSLKDVSVCYISSSAFTSRPIPDTLHRRLWFGTEFLKLSVLIQRTARRRCNKGSVILHE